MRIRFLRSLTILFSFLLINSYAAQVGLTITDESGTQGNYIEVPVRVDSNLTGLDITAYQLEIYYNDSYLRFEEVVSGGTMTEQFTSFSFNQKNNYIDIAAAGDTPLTGSGNLVLLRFKMIRVGTAYVRFSDAEHNMLNEGEPQLILTDGYVSISARPGLSFSPNYFREIVVGDQLQYSVSGGTAPYSWSVTEPAVADIDNTGLLTALSMGATRVIAEDATGIIDTANHDVKVHPLRVTTPDTVIYQGYTLDLPVYISDMSGLDIKSGSFSVKIDADLVQVVDILTGGALLAGHDKPEFYVSNEQLNIAFAGSSVLSGAGILLYIRFQVLADNQGSFYPEISDFLCNETLTALSDIGWIRVDPLPDLTITPNVSWLMAGDTVRFSASGGTEPYTWSTSDPTVASIDSEGLLTAIKGGTVYAQAQDAIGATGQSSAITIYDTEVTLPDTTAEPGDVFDFPVLIGPVTAGTEIFGVQFSINYDTTALKEAEIISTGTLSDGWSVSQNIKGELIHFAGAGSNPITNQGILLFIRFHLSPDISLGYFADLYFDEMILNEGAPSARPVDGSIKFDITAIPEKKYASLPDKFQLFQNYPNPFNPLTVIRYSLTVNSEVELSVCNMLGQKVAVLVSQRQPAGEYKVEWNGAGLPSGVYLYTLRTSSGFRQSRKMILLK